MKFDVYAANGIFVETIEVESEEELVDVAWELCKEWLCKNYVLGALRTRKGKLIMLISELIVKLEEFKAQNGDIETTIYDEYGECVPFDCFIGINEDEEEVVVFYE